MFGAIAGDMIGSIYERRHHAIKTEDFPLFSADSHFTDDTVLTIAVADVILHHGDYAKTIYSYGQRYPNAGYGHAFRSWMHVGNRQPYYSYGNGSAMRVSPVGWAFDTEEDVLREAERSAGVTHNHPEGIKGAQAVALAIYLARHGASKTEIHNQIQARFNYDLDRSLEEIRPTYQFDSSCQGSVPESLIAFFESNSVESAIRKAVSLGGDSDTMACITGSVAEAFYRVIPDGMYKEVVKRLPVELLEVVNTFNTTYRIHHAG